MPKIKKGSDKKLSDKDRGLLWDGIGEEDFLNESGFDDKDIVEFNYPKAVEFIQNINLMRQLVRLSDSLKPVERRTLYVMHQKGAIPSKKSQKASKSVGDIMEYHAHSDASIYKTIIGMSQYWVKPVPLIHVAGNNANIAEPKKFAHMRYTEVTTSKYTEECFFSDFDPDCVEMIFNSAYDGDEPLALPNKFPNILVNGGAGIAVGNQFMIPPFNINDIIKVFKRLMKNPNHPDIAIVPDLPTGCDIVDDGTFVNEMIEKGTGTLRMRSTINIMETKKHWVLQIVNVPWMVNLVTVQEKIIDLVKKKILPIQDIQDHCYQVKEKGEIRTIVDIRLYIDKAHDPYSVRSKLYKLTELAKHQAINFKVVTDDLGVECFGLREFALSWLDGRREYKRRIFNKKIAKIQARLAILDILIYLTDKDHLVKTVKIIQTNTKANAVSALQKYGNMTSFQASEILTLGLTSFTSDAHDRYVEEKKEKRKVLEECMEKVRSEKKIDEIISIELDDLAKYAQPRRSKLIDPEKGVYIPNTNHMVIITRMNMIKKLPMPKDGSRSTYGTFKQYDYPIDRLDVNNLESIMFFDSTGRYTNMPVNQIDNTEHSHIGSPAYDVTKLDGNLVAMLPDIQEVTKKTLKQVGAGKPNLLTLTADGYMKETPIEEYTELKNSKKVRAMKVREGDRLIYANIILDSSSILIYTKRGKYIYINNKDIPIAGRDTQGLQCIKLEDGDECVGCCVIGDKDEYILVVTEKGLVKKCEISVLGEAGRRKTGASYMTTLDSTDSVNFVCAFEGISPVTVCTRLDTITLDPAMIPTLTRRAKGQKLIPIPQGCNIIAVKTD